MELRTCEAVDGNKYNKQVYHRKGLQKLLVNLIISMMVKEFSITRFVACEFLKIS